MTQNKSIHWQQFLPAILALLGMVWAGGQFYNKSTNLEQKVINSEENSKQNILDVNGRLDRQYETILKLNDRIIDVEKKAAYQQGYHDGKGEHEKTLEK